MKRVGLLVREQIVDEIIERTKEAEACFFINFSKIGAFPMNTVRNDLVGAGATVFVAKNSLVKRAFGDLEISDADEFLAEETGVVFVHDKDIVKAAKVLVDFSKENENFQVKGGLLKGEKFDANAFNALAKLPPKEVLLGMALGAMASPLTGFLTSLNQVILKFVWVVEEIKKTKGQS